MKTILAFIGVAALLLGYPAAYYLSQEEIAITVTKTERVNKGDDSKYLVFTDTETFENTDSWLFWKLDSSDLHGHMKPNNTYSVKVAGWRWKMFSSYRNIIYVKE